MGHGDDDDRDAPVAGVRDYEGELVLGPRRELGFEMVDEDFEVLVEEEEEGEVRQMG